MASAGAPSLGYGASTHIARDGNDSNTLENLAK